jgi:hypothetical protein
MLNPKLINVVSQVGMDGDEATWTSFLYAAHASAAINCANIGQLLSAQGDPK